MNRALATFAFVAVALAASACSGNDKGYQPPPGAIVQKTLPAGTWSPESGSAEAFVSTAPPREQSRHAAETTRELTPDESVVHTEGKTPCAPGKFYDKDPVTGRVLERVMECLPTSHPDEQSARCVNTRTTQCFLGVRDGNKCTPHKEMIPCS